MNILCIFLLHKWEHIAGFRNYPLNNTTCLRKGCDQVYIAYPNREEQ